MPVGRIRASFESTTRSCWRHWMWRSQDLSMNFTPKKSSVQWKQTTSTPRWRRSERTRSYCQCSVASLLNSFNCFSMHSTTADSNTSAMLLLADDQVWQHFECFYLVIIGNKCSEFQNYCCIRYITAEVNAGLSLTTRPYTLIHRLTSLTRQNSFGHRMII